MMIAEQCATSADAMALQWCFEIVQSIAADKRTAYRPLYRIVVHWQDWADMGKPLHLELGRFGRVPVQPSGLTPGQYSWHYMRGKRKRRRPIKMEAAL